MTLASILRFSSSIRFEFLPLPLPFDGVDDAAEDDAEDSSLGVSSQRASGFGDEFGDPLGEIDSEKRFIKLRALSRMGEALAGPAASFSACTPPAGSSSPPMFNFLRAEDSVNFLTDPGRHLK